jgi:hypothetical protein
MGSKSSLIEAFWINAKNLLLQSQINNRLLLAQKDNGYTQMRGVSWSIVLLHSVVIMMCLLLFSVPWLARSRISITPSQQAANSVMDCKTSIMVCDDCAVDWKRVLLAMILFLILIRIKCESIDSFRPQNLLILLAMFMRCADCVCDKQLFDLVGVTVTSRQVADSATASDCAIFRLCVFSTIAAGSQEGAICMSLGSMAIFDSIGFQCTSSVNGGWISHKGKWLTLSRCCGAQCSAQRGAVWSLVEGWCFIDQQTVWNCGGTYGIPFRFLYRGNANVMHTNFSDCTSTGGGFMLENDITTTTPVVEDHIGFVIGKNVKGDAGWAMKTALRTTFEYVIHIDCTSTSYSLIVGRTASSTGCIIVYKCLFRGITGGIFALLEDAKATFYISQCVFDKDVPTVPSGTMIDNFCSFVDGLSLIQEHEEMSCIKFYFVTDGETPTSSLTCAICTSSTAVHEGKDWVLGNSRPSESSETCLVAKFSSCIFCELQSVNANGGGVSIQGGGTSSAEFHQCQFMECHTPVGGSFYGGAIFVSVVRVDLEDVCAASCYSVLGTFLSCGGDVELWLVCGNLDIYDCGTAALDIDGGAVIHMNSGNFVMKTVNVTDCKQKTGAAIFQQSTDAADLTANGFFYFKCLGCSGTDGYEIKLVGKVTFQDSVFVGNSVSNAWFTVSGKGLVVFQCDFIENNGNMFNMINTVVYLVVWSCRFDSAQIAGAIPNGGTVTHAVFGYVNDVTFGKALQHCSLLYWRYFSRDFSQSSGFGKTKTHLASDSFSETNTYTPSGLISKTNGFSETNDLTQTNQAFSGSSSLSKSSDAPATDTYSSSDTFQATHSLSESGSFTATLGVSETDKFSQSLSVSPTLGGFLDTSGLSLTVPGFNKDSGTYSASSTFSVTSSFSTTPLFSGSEKMSVASTKTNKDALSALSAITVSGSKLAFSPTPVSVIASELSFGGTVVSLSTQSPKSLSSSSFSSVTAVLPVATKSPGQTEIPVVTEPPDSTFPPATQLSFGLDYTGDRPSSIPPRSTVPPATTVPPKPTNTPVRTDTPRETQSPWATVSKTTIPSQEAFSSLISLSTVTEAAILSSSGVLKSKDLDSISETELAMVKDEEIPVSLLVTVIVLMVLGITIWVYLMYTQNRHRKDQVMKEERNLVKGKMK